eukprot:COSAG01_NODE_25943_length_728_cov_1.141494_1_plen_197_part_10
MVLRCCSVVGSAIAAGVLAIVVEGIILQLSGPPPSTDPRVRALAQAFSGRIASASAELVIESVGELRRDLDTTGWALLANHFGSNPNTPYMFNVLPLWNFALPSPIYHVRARDAVVLLSRLPPRTVYFSFTTFAAWLPRRGVAFSSVGDSVNNLNINSTADGLFAHVVTGSQRTYREVVRALTSSSSSGGPPPLTPE